MKLLNLGCGYRFHPDWINVDFVSTGQGVIAYNLTQGIPFPDDSFDVVYHSHMLEHLSKEGAKMLLKECDRVLRPQGIIRVVIPDLEAHFYGDESCLSRKFDLVFASTSLHYSQNWQHTLKGLAEATRDYLFITRLPIVHQVSSYVMVQRPYQYGYNTEYLGWCLNKEEFLSVAASLNLELMREFISQVSPYVNNAPAQPQYWGFLFARMKI